MINISYNVDYNEWNKQYPLYKKYISNTVNITLKHVENDAGKNLAISFLLTSNENIKELNRKFRKKNRPTNVLSFPMMKIYEGISYLGDIALSLETLKLESDNQNMYKYDYLCKMTAHGMLHLLGYDHKTEKQYRHMTNLEKRILLKIKKL